MYKFNITSNHRRQQTAVMGTGYRNKCYDDDQTQVCYDTGPGDDSPGISQLQHRHESRPALSDQGGLPSTPGSHRYHTCMERKENLGDIEYGDVNVMESERYDGQIEDTAKARGRENVKCNQSNGLESDITNKNEIDESDFPDGGWGYVVLLGCFFIRSFASVIGTCYGILFSTFLLDLDTSSTTVAWIYNVGSFMWSIASLLMGPVVQRFGCRTVTVTGGVLASLGLGISAFAPSALFLLFSYSLLTGFGCGMSHLGVNVITSQYFKRRRGRAYAVVHAGMCTGQIVMPLLITYLQQEYGFKGATLIMAALLLNICVGACVFHPVEWHTSKSSHVTDRNTNTNYSLRNSTEPGCGVTLLRMICTLVTNFRVLRSLRVVIIVVGTCFFVSGYLTFSSMLPFVMADAGYTQEEVSWCMSVSGGCNLVTRLVVPSMTDWPRFSKRGCYMAGIATIALTIGVFSVVPELWGLAAVAGAWGCGVGACSCLTILIILDYLGLENFVAVLGICAFVSGAWVLAFGVVFGVVRDASGSYTASLSALAAIVFISFLLWLFMPAAVAFDLRKKVLQQQQQQEEEAQQQQETQQQQQ